MNVLIINAGSSSLKYQLMNPETGDVSAKGLCERIYIDGRLTHKVGDKTKPFRVKETLPHRNILYPDWKIKRYFCDWAMRLSVMTRKFCVP